MSSFRAGWPEEDDDTARGCLVVCLLWDKTSMTFCPQLSPAINIGHVRFSAPCTPGDLVAGPRTGEEFTLFLSGSFSGAGPSSTKCDNPRGCGFVGQVSVGGDGTLGLQEFDVLRAPNGTETAPASFVGQLSLSPHGFWAGGVVYEGERPRNDCRAPDSQRAAVSLSLPFLPA